MSSNQSGEGDIRRALIEGDLVDCVVALPGLFYSTQIPVCLWFLTKNKSDGKRRDRRGQTLIMDARKLGTLIDPVHRDLTDADLLKIVSTYHAWRGEKCAGKYEDVPGFCMSATAGVIAGHGYVLTPGRYVDGEPFEEKMTRLVGELYGQFAESARLEEAIRANLRGLGYGGSVRWRAMDNCRCLRGRSKAPGEWCCRTMASGVSRARIGPTEASMVTT